MHIKKSLIAFSLLAALSVAPWSAYGQTASSTTNEGVPEPAAIEAHDSRRYSGVIQSRVSALPAEAVQDLPIPILFGFSTANLTRNFGDPRSGGRTHEGLDLMAVKSAPIVSPTRAVVLGKGIWAGAGNYVSTANPGGETFVYMHLDQPSQLNDGDVLQPGDLIGYVGNTGNAAGGATHLHFEIRKNGVATDPYPRLTKEFPLSEKIFFATTLLSHSTDKPALAQFLIANYFTELSAAKNASLTLPTEIETELQKIAAQGTAAMANFANLTFGMRSEAVVSMQQFLITQNRGPAAQTLARAGATGYFGTITQNALDEYRGIAPVATPAPQPTSPQPTSGGLALNSNLTIGSRGLEVLQLQSFLISKQTGPAAATLNASGATGYFGPITRNALAEYQSKVGISPALGYCGPLTRQYLITAH